jgi:hypothetical protein
MTRMKKRFLEGTHRADLPERYYPVLALIERETGPRRGTDVFAGAIQTTTVEEARAYAQGRAYAQAGKGFVGKVATIVDAPRATIEEAVETAYALRDELAALMERGHTHD